MRKYEMWIAFILALILMLLASCKSKQLSINEQVDSVSTKAFTLADMRSQMLDFCFDSMCIDILDTFPSLKAKSYNAKSYKMKIMGGKVRSESQETRAETLEMKDSLKTHSEYHAEKNIGPKGRNYTPYIIIGGLVMFLLLLLAKKVG